jgi:exodeoxyribonuclease V gamma subunit
MVFGITALPMQTMQALVALGRHLPVLMFVHNPCREHWGHVSEDMSSGGHPLLAAWGKQGRDYLHAIDQFEAQDEHSPVYQRVTAFVDPVAEATEAQMPVSVLQHLQSGLLHLQASKTINAPADDSVMFVQTHSPQREVEVLHDQVLGWLNADPQLQPADIMVMVPDMALFAPHIHAVFGRYAGSGQTVLDLPYSVTDSTPRSHPLVQAVDSLLQLPQLRLTLSEWLGMFQVKAVRQRYGLSETEVEKLHTWLSEAGVRWGLDAQQRRQWGMDPALPDADQNTWSFGLRRLLLGYALGPQSHDAVWLDTAAQPGVDGLDAPLIAGLLQWLDDMNRHGLILQADRSPQDWLPCMQHMLDRFFKAEDEADQRVLDQLLEPLQDWLADCQMAGLDEPVSLGVLRSHWMAQLDTVGLQRRFAAGGVQFATLMPMRAIPFKVVCLLGMNDSAYPRSPTPRDFDLISHAGNHRPGDRARREDDRYLFLEALLSARQRLYISWQGRRASDHAVLPPSVLVAQLMDYLNPGGQVAGAGPKPYTASLQPLQAFSRRYFQQGSGFATYAAEWATVRQARSQRVSSAVSVLPPPDQLTEQSLLTLLRQPVEVFFKHHLQVTLDTPQLNDEDNEPFNWSGLHGYRLKQQVLYSDQAQAMLQRMKLQGVLPMAGGGEWQQTQMLDLQHKVLAQLAPWQQPKDSDLPLQIWRSQAHGCGLSLPWGGDPQRWRLHADGSVLQMGMRAGDVLKDNNIRLDTLPHLWLGHLSANAAGARTTSVLSGANGVVCLQPVTADRAQACLQDLMLLYREAWARPLPLAIKSAGEFLIALDKSSKTSAPELQIQQALVQARQAFQGNRFVPGECQSSPYVHRVYPRFDHMDPAIFSALAVRVYGPLREACSGNVALREEASA